MEEQKLLIPNHIGNEAQRFRAVLDIGDASAFAM